MTAVTPSVHPLRRLLALVALVATVIGVPLGLWRLGAGFLPDALPSWTQITAALSRPDTGAVFLGLLVVIGWTAWGVFTLAVAVELAAQMGGRPPLRLPGLTVPQQLAGLLVAAVVGAAGAPLLAGPALAAPPIVADRPIDPPPPAPEQQANPAPTAPTEAGPTYIVQPRDTLGRIAARYLGDWTRFEEIVDLNRGRPQPDGSTLTDPGLVRPGWVLVLPPDATLPGAEPTAGEVIVRPGDTLAGIAEQHGLDSWRPVFDLNAGEPLPGGGRFTDPDLIRPGQLLDLPAIPTAPTPTTTPEPPPTDTPPAPPPPGGGPSTPAQPTPAPSSPSEQPVPATESPGSATDHRAAEADQSSGELAAVLAGAGALLAAGLATAWAAHRRQRLRRRRPGRRLAPSPIELSATQAALTAAASSGKADYAALDLALRGLAVLLSDDPAGRLPDIIAARLTEGRLQLRLHTPVDRPPPQPWTADEAGCWWSVDLAAAVAFDPQRARGRLAPYPTLVTIGNDAGVRWLLDLERIGVLRVSGPPARREDFARHLAAELAVNSWSDLLTVTIVGFGRELVDLAPDRLHPVDHMSAAGLEKALREASDEDRSDVLEGRLRVTVGDGLMPEIILAPHPEDADALPEPAAAHTEPDRRPFAVVLGVAATEATDAWGLTLTDDGALLVPDLDLRLPAPQLTSQQGQDIAALLLFERDTADALIPAAEGTRPWQTHTDAAGALRHDLRPPPDDEPEAVAGPAESAGAAERTQAVSHRDADSLRQRLEADLGQLDRDLADWWSPHCSRPRLTLLGPVTLRAHGDEQVNAKSGLRRRHEEAIAYLATRPHGATVDETAEALQPIQGAKSDQVSARAYVHRVIAGARAWLGTDPVTGEPHLSAGRHRPYSLQDVLVDADLFRQLRARAGIRGGDGMPDLLAALELVTGPPFAQHPAGYEWLGGLDLTYTAAICDVAHQVVTTTLADEDLDAARTASATALLVAPDDETVLLDAMWVAFHEGNQAEAEAYIARIVEVHDGEDEMDLPLSTAETINRARRQHLHRAS